MELPHTGEDHLVGLTVHPDGERGVLYRKLVEDEPHLLEVILPLRRNGDGDNRGPNLDGLEENGKILVRYRLPRREVLETRYGTDVASLYRFRLFPLVRGEPDQPAHALRLVPGGVQHRVALVKLS